MPGRSPPSAVLVVPSRTPPELRAPGLLTDRMAARPTPPGACGKPVDRPPRNYPPCSPVGRFFLVSTARSAARALPS